MARVGSGGGARVQRGEWRTCKASAHAGCGERERANEYASSYSPLTASAQNPRVLYPRPREVVSEHSTSSNLSSVAYGRATRLSARGVGARGVEDARPASFCPRVGVVVVSRCEYRDARAPPFFWRRPVPSAFFDTIPSPSIPSTSPHPLTYRSCSCIPYSPSPIHIMPFLPCPFFFRLPAPHCSSFPLSSLPLRSISTPTPPSPSSPLPFLPAVFVGR
ncbi:hypothetical protein C8R44DRAFT_981800 [Mycena epipterygia]|nr:hypothetical protein C8R44DRAFT_981800 [Mycena epipterygia]